MIRNLFGVVAVCAVAMPSVSPAEASELEFAMGEGRVTIRAQDVSVQQILDEWGRIGNTTIIDADGLSDGLVTLELNDVPEAVALRTLLRSAAGYLAAPRTAGAAGNSYFDRILILAASGSSRRSASASPVPRRSRAVSERQTRAPGRLRVPDAGSGRTPFEVTEAQQEQLAQLQELLQRPEDDGDASEPDEVPPVFGNIPAPRPGLPMGTGDSNGQVSVPTGAFGTTMPTPTADDRDVVRQRR